MTTQTLAKLYQDELNGGLAKALRPLHERRATFFIAEASI
jgi:hypothetical protein